MGDFLPAEVLTPTLPPLPGINLASPSPSAFRYSPLGRQGTLGFDRESRVCAAGGAGDETTIGGARVVESDSVDDDEYE